MSLIDNFQIHLNSKFANYTIGNNSQCFFSLPETEVSDRCQLFVNVFQCSIPYSFYNVNNNNNQLNYIVLGNSLTILIPLGNYTAISLTSYLNLNLTGFSAIYNSSTNKITLSHVSNDFSLLSSSTCLNLLGFSDIQYYSSNLSLTSVQMMNMNPINCICIMSNFETNNINVSHINNRRVLISIPVNVNPLGLINYYNYDNLVRNNIYTNKFNSIEIRLTDQDHNNLDLNGVDWTMTLQFSVIHTLD